MAAKLPIVGMKNLSKDLRLEMINIGMSIMGDLATEIAKEADRNAPTIKSESVKHPSGLRRGPDKSGGRGTSGPIKGSVFAQESQKVAYSWLVVAPAWYSHLVEYGTKAHKIAPKKKKNLVFVGRSHAHQTSKSGKRNSRAAIQGLVVTPKTVNHPGTKGRGRRAFMRPAADKAELILKKLLSQLK